MSALYSGKKPSKKQIDELQELLDGSFEALGKAVRGIFDKYIPEEDKKTLIDIAVRRLRVIGKALKTQKVWRVGEDFKKAYTEEMRRLMKIFKDGGEEALMRELLDKDAINIFSLDENGIKVYEKVTGEKVEDDVEGSDFEAVDEEAEEKEK